MGFLNFLQKDCSKIYEVKGVQVWLKFDRKSSFSSFGLGSLFRPKTIAEMSFFPPSTRMEEFYVKVIIRDSRTCDVYCNC
ncbi:hypothetical protein Nepgr_004170 [Nepenthes gracilis]|uniref:Uncharacterized protein n=1 Tax=Nepenthes gracilis TaxID=150966 RepID=A0AAD3S159_NEPGR|nr:hypothetical protein Nepgr_004170 [Nepenthes gracilis]